MAEMTVFFDIDGVLAEYTLEDYLGDPMPFAKPGIHYFSNRDVDSTAWSVLDFIKRVAKEPIVVLTTLSSVTMGDKDLFEEHVADKREWVNRVSKEMGVGRLQIVFAQQCQTSKASAAASFLGRPLKKSDILVDDFNDNLFDWWDAGGTSVKYLNGVNSRGSWQRHSIDGLGSEEKARETMDGILKQVLKEGSHE